MQSKFVVLAFFAALCAMQGCGEPETPQQPKVEQDLVEVAPMDDAISQMKDLGENVVEEVQEVIKEAEVASTSSDDSSSADEPSSEVKTVEPTKTVEVVEKKPSAAKKALKIAGVVVVVVSVGAVATYYGSKHTAEQYFAGLAADTAGAVNLITTEDKLADMDAIMNIADHGDGTYTSITDGRWKAQLFYWITTRVLGCNKVAAFSPEVCNGAWDPNFHGFVSSVGEANDWETVIAHSPKPNMMFNWCRDLAENVFQANDLTPFRKLVGTSKDTFATDLNLSRIDHEVADFTVTNAFIRDASYEGWQGCYVLQMFYRQWPLPESGHITEPTSEDDDVTVTLGIQERHECTGSNLHWVETVSEVPAALEGTDLVWDRWYRAASSSVIDGDTFTVDSDGMISCGTNNVALSNAVCDYAQGFWVLPDSSNGTGHDDVCACTLADDTLSKVYGDAKDPETEITNARVDADDGVITCPSTQKLEDTEFTAQCDVASGKWVLPGWNNNNYVACKSKCASHPELYGVADDGNTSDSSQIDSDNATVDEHGNISCSSNYYWGGSGNTARCDEVNSQWVVGDDDVAGTKGSDASASDSAVCKLDCQYGDSLGDTTLNETITDGQGAVELSTPITCQAFDTSYNTGDITFITCVAGEPTPNTDNCSE